MTRIYWDSMLFVYWIEDHPEYAGRVQQIYETMQERGDTLSTSVFTLGEVLVGPYQRKAHDLVRSITEYFTGPDVDLLPMSKEAAVEFARIRSTQRVSPADAIHLATAANSGVDLFLTNDHRLHRLIVPGIRFIAGLDVNVF